MVQKNRNPLKWLILVCLVAFVISVYFAFFYDWIPDASDKAVPDSVRLDSDYKEESRTSSVFKKVKEYIGLVSPALKRVPFKQESPAGYPSDITPQLTKTDNYTLEFRETAEGKIPYLVAKNMEEMNKHGFILEFKEIPVMVREAELEREIRQLKEEAAQLRKESGSLSGSLAMAKLDKAFEIETTIKEREKSITEVLRKHRQKIADEHAKVISDVMSRITRRPLRVGNEYTNVFNGIALNITAEEVSKLKDSMYIKAVYPNMEVKAVLIDSVPLINADDVWNMQDYQGENITGKNVTIAVIDTGIDFTNPDLGNCTVEQIISGGCEKVAGSYDFVNHNSYPYDDFGHGTHCAGIAAGNGVLKGVAPDVKLYSYKVLNSDGYGKMSDVISAIELAVDPNNDGDFSDHADIVSMSLGADCSWGGYNDACGPNDAVSKTVDGAVDAGVIIVVAAGNSGPNKQTVSSPGTARKAITVGAVFKKDYVGTYWGDTDPKADQITKFSSRGPVISKGEVLVKPDIVAPGAIICAARYDDIFPEGYNPLYYPCIDDKHVQLAGTSMATPHIAGAVALIRQAHPDWSPEEVKSALKSTAKDLGYDLYTQGHGRVDVLRTLQLSGAPPIAVFGYVASSSGRFNIIGTAAGRDFNNYVLYFSKDSMASWTKLTTSTTPVINGILYSIDSNLLSDESNYFKLVVKNSKGEEAYDIGVIHSPCKGCRDGWPKFYEPNTIYGFDLQQASPLCTDINNDGKNEIIALMGYNDFDFFYLDVYAWDYDGSTVTGFPISLTGPPTGIGAVSSPASADLDGDRQKEIVSSGGNSVYIFSGEGKTKAWWDSIMDGWGQAPCSPVIADLDGDGDKEIIQGESNPFLWWGFIFPRDSSTSCTTDSNCRLGWKCYNGKCSYFFNKLYAWHHDGKPVAGWPVVKYAETFGTPAVGDINNDGKEEVATISAGTSNYFFGGKVYLEVFKGDGSPLEGWPRELFDSDGVVYFANSPVLANIDSEPDLEIIVSIQNHNKVYAFKANGEYAPGWPFVIPDASAFSYGLAVGDINGDGSIEIVFGDSNGGTHMVSQDGAELPGWPKFTPYQAAAVMPSPILGNIDSDSAQEVLSMVNYSVFAWDAKGNLITGFPKKLDSSWRSVQITATPTICDIGDNKSVLVTMSQKGTVYAFDLSYYNQNTTAWPMLQHDPQHTGKYVCNDLCQLGTTRCFDSVSYQTCSNHNTDPCLEWGMPLPCDTGLCDTSLGRCADCYDSDGGQDYTIKGYVVYKGTKYWDECWEEDGGRSVMEYYCLNLTFTDQTKRPPEQTYPFATIIHKCDNGCEDGACIGSACGILDIYAKQVPGYVYYNLYMDVENLPSVTSVTSGNEFGIIGTSSSWDTLKFKPSLSDGAKTILIATQTVNSVGISYIMNRKDNISLTYNNAIVCAQCKDSDGENYYTQGTATGVYDGSMQSKTDECINYDAVREWICRGHKLSNIVYTCTGGCSDGKCTCTTPPDTCSLLGKQCGTWPDKCGGTVDCGLCPTTQCSAPHTIGDCTQSCSANGMCEPCTPTCQCTPGWYDCDNNINNGCESTELCIGSACGILDIYAKQVPGYVYYNLYMDVENLSSVTSGNEFGIIGTSSSWDTLKFKPSLSDGAKTTLIATQTVNSVGISYIMNRKDNISLTYNNAIVCA